jgi:hypothetical protein
MSLSSTVAPTTLAPIVITPAPTPLSTVQ